MFQTDTASAIDPDLGPLVASRSQGKSVGGSEFPVNFDVVREALSQVEIGASVLELTTDPSAPRHHSRYQNQRGDPGAVTTHTEIDLSRRNRWETSMADVVAHLVSAHQLLSGLMEIATDPPMMGLSADLASHGICAALVSLDECSEIERGGQVGLASEDMPWTPIGATWRDVLGDPSSS